MAAKEDNEAKLKLVKRIEQSKQIQTIESRIGTLVLSPQKATSVLYKNELLKPDFFQMVKFYFDRIPELRKYIALESQQRFKGDNFVRFTKMIQEFRKSSKIIKDWVFLPYSEHKSYVDFPKDIRFPMDSITTDKIRRAEPHLKKQFIKHCVNEIKKNYGKQLSLVILASQSTKRRWQISCLETSKQ